MTDTSPTALIGHGAGVSVPDAKRLHGAYAVIFISQRREAEHDSYGVTADRMVELAAQQPGYLGVQSVRGVEGLGITVSYWQTLDHISQWRNNAEHTLARQYGRERWYESYQLQISKIERAYDFARAD